MGLLKRGILIAIEGIDGSGKTSLVQNLYQIVKSQLSNVLLTKEPGGSHLGKYLREILQKQTMTICPKAEFLLFVADRAQHFAEVIMPALSKNTLIISDRLCDSSVVYQGYGRGLDIATIKAINKWAMNSIQPDLTFYVRIDPKIAYQRLIDRGKFSAFDKAPLEFFEKLVEGFEQLYAHKENVFVIDGTLPPDELAHLVKEKLFTWIKKHNELRKKK